MFTEWASNFDNVHSLKITGCHDYEPKPNKIYFGLDNNPQDPVLYQDFRNLPVLIVGVCFYNENAVELRRILVSLADQIHELKNQAICQVLFLSDGHQQMAQDTKEYFRHIFCTTRQESKHWDELMQSMDDYCQQLQISQEDERRGISVKLSAKPPPHLTYVVQRVGHFKNEESQIMLERSSVKIPGAKDNKIRKLPLSLILKAGNRRKHNSQEWILKSFASQSVLAPNQTGRYVFLSDCGTLFEPGCLQRLLRYMNKNPLCVGCTGRQRVMTALEQDLPDEKRFSMSRIFRKVQQADYEASYAIYTGAFAAAGCLPVLPGPCAMFRYQALVNQRQFRMLDPLETLLSKSCHNQEMQTLFDKHTIKLQGPTNPEISEISETCDLEQGDVLISVPLSGYTTSSESALEHFTSLITTPPEKTDLVIENVKLAEDRIPSYAVVTHGQKGAYTTWVDGAVFKFQAETDLRSWVFQRRRWINGAFSCYIWNTLSKSHLIWGSNHTLLRKCLIYTLFLTQLLNHVIATLSPAIFGTAIYLAILSLFDVQPFVPLIVIISYGFFTLMFMWVHKYVPFVKPLFYLMTFINAGAIIFVLVAYLKQCVDVNFSPNSAEETIIQWTALGILVIPFAMAIISWDWKSFKLLIFSYVPYVLFLPTLVGSFTIYALARLSDTTWGNRISTEKSAFKSITHTQLTDLQKDLSSNASVALLFTSIANIAIESVIISFNKNSRFIATCIVFILLPIAIQSLISVIFFLLKHVSGKTYRQRKNKFTK